MYTVKPLNSRHIGAGLLSIVERSSLSQRLTNWPHPQSWFGSVSMLSTLMVFTELQHAHAPAA